MEVLAHGDDGWDVDETQAKASTDPVAGAPSHVYIITRTFKRLSHENQGGYCYLSIESSFQGLLSPIIKF